MFELQGHRGARGLAPENTLAGFEIALGHGVASIETDVHLTRDDIAVLIHDARPTPDAALVRELTLAQLRAYRVPGPAHPPTPLAERFAQERGIDPHGIPTLMEFFDFVALHGRPIVFDLELKRVPFHPETIGDGFDGANPALLERLTVAAIRHAGVLARTRVRSFDHRCLRAIKQLEPSLEIGLLIHHTVPANLGALLADADVYCPEYHFVDADVVRQVHEAGKRIIPYTGNDPSDWQRLLAWGVDGMTTDYPDRFFTPSG